MTVITIRVITTIGGRDMALAGALGTMGLFMRASGRMGSGMGWGSLFRQRLMAIRRNTGASG